MTASKRNPWGVPRRVAEYIRELQTEYNFPWDVDSVERNGNQYVINSSFEEDYGWSETPYSEWIPEIHRHDRRDVVEFVGRQVPVRVMSIFEF